jgi:hypothetical protein
VVGRPCSFADSRDTLGRAIHPSCPVIHLCIRRPFPTASAAGNPMSSSSQTLVEATDFSDASTPSTPESPLRQTLGILRLAWPAVVGNLLYSTVAMVDIKIVGSLGATAVAAVTTGNRVFFVFQAVIMATSAGTAAMVARARVSRTPRIRFSGIAPPPSNSYHRILQVLR